MRIYCKKDIYFNPVVSQYFKVPFDNLGISKNLLASKILNCSVVTWDIDTKKLLSDLEDQQVSMLGRGSGLWQIFIDQVPEQNKPNTDKWNAPDDDLQAENGRSAMKDLGEFLKGVNMLFI